MEDKKMEDRKMEEKKTVTPIEGLNIAVRELMNISVPVGLTEQISLPMSRAIDLIRQIIPLVTEKPQEKPQEPPKDADVIDLGELNLDEAEPAEEKSSEEENADA